MACLDEGAELRRAGLELPILILGHTPPEQAPEVVELGLTQTVFTPELAGALSRAAGAVGTRAKVHLKLDTGMSRLGILAHDPERAAQEVAALCDLPHLDAEGIFTHFANADGDEGYTMLQFTRFLDVLAELENKYHRQFAIRHCAASAAVLHYPCTHLDMVRPGVALYGHYPDPSCQGLDGPGLLPVMSFKTRVAAVRDLPANTPVSYGCTGQVGAEGGRMAVLPWAMPTDCTGCCPIKAASGWPARPGPSWAGCAWICAWSPWTKTPKWNQETRRRSLVPTCQRRSRQSWPAPSNMSCCAPSLPGCPGCMYDGGSHRRFTRTIK